MSVVAAPAPIFSPGFALNPRPTLAWLRREDPLHGLAPGVLVVTRFADCRAALVDDRFSAAGGQEARRERSGAATSMLNTDGEQHRRLRRPGMDLLGPAAVARLAPGIGTAVGRLLASLSDHGAVDLASAVAEPVASLSLAHALGVQSDAEIDRFPQLCARLAVALDPMPSQEAADQGRAAVADFEAWLDAHLSRNPEGRLAHLATDGIRTEDVIGIANLAVVGGWAPLAELLTTALELTLFDSAHRDAATGPGADSWCEDVIRWHTPIPFVSRRADADVPLPSGVVPAGTQVLIHIDAADHDPETFDDPATIDAGRDRVRSHLAFGGGAHFCLGAPLVRAVVPQVTTTFHRMFPHARSRGSLFVWRPGIFPRRPVSTTVDLR